MSQLLGLRGVGGALNGLGMLLGSFLGRGLMQSQSDAQLPICHLLKDFRDLSERENLLELK